MPTPALDIQHLSKTYKNGLTAVDDISFKVEEGDFFALLGPNGAGKSTTIGIIDSIVSKTSGSVKIFGVDIDKQPALAKAHLGIVPQEVNFSIFEKVINTMHYQGGFYGMSPRKTRQNTERYLKQLDLWDKRNGTIRNLSGGMKRRLMIARALINEPKLVILDEPTAGVDIEARRTMWEFMQEVNRQGTTIILTTHYLEEAEQLCKNIAIINHGKIVTNEPMASLLGKLQQESFIIEFKQNCNNIDPPKEYQRRWLDDCSLEVTVEKTIGLGPLLRWLGKQEVEVCGIRNKSNRLEELFLQLIKSNNAEAAANE